MSIITRPVRFRSRTAPRSSLGRKVVALRGLLPIALVLLGWQLAGNPDSLSFPVPDRWASSLKEIHSDGLLMPALGITLRTFAISLVSATFVGVAVGALVGSSRLASRALTPLLDFVRAMPPPAIVPIGVLVLGTSVLMSSTVVAFAIVWPILLSTATAVRSMPPVRREMAAMIGLSLRERVLKVMLPSLLPSIFIGIRISVSISLVVTLIVDVFGAGAGIGRLIVERQQSFDASAVWGLLFVIGALGALLNGLFAAVERLVLRHHPPSRA